MGMTDPKNGKDRVKTRKIRLNNGDEWPNKTNGKDWVERGKVQFKNTKGLVDTSQPSYKALLFLHILIKKTFYMSSVDFLLQLFPRQLFLILFSSIFSDCEEFLAAETYKYSIFLSTELLM